MGKRKIDIPRELTAMKNMSAGDLRGKYAELYGEASRSGNRQWLFRRCAWRLQSLAEGGLSERARRRAKELARDADIRVIPPADLVRPAPDRPGHRRQPARKYLRANHDPRLPMPGTRIPRPYKGHTCVVEVLSNGFAYDGEFYRSLSAVAHAITGSHWNGYLFFGIQDPRKGDE